MNEIKTAQDRTDAKLRYARIHLKELHNYYSKGSGDDFERSHQESFLFHLYGVRDAFLQELNLYYNCGLELKDVNDKKLKKILNTKGLNSPELEKLKSLEDDPASWLSIGKEMRHHSTHRGSVPRLFHIFGDKHGQQYFIHPRSGETISEDYANTFDYWCSEMEELIKKLRNSAVST